MKQPLREAQLVLNHFYPISKLARIDIKKTLTSNEKQHYLFFVIWGKSSYIFDINKEHLKNEKKFQTINHLNHRKKKQNYHHQPLICVQMVTID
jgi:hypothetical protein